MKPIEFDELNVLYGEGQPEYEPLPAHRDENGNVTTCWKLSPEELQTIQETGVIWLVLATFNDPLQPMYLSVEKPLEPIKDENKGTETI